MHAIENEALRSLWFRWKEQWLLFEMENVAFRYDEHKMKNNIKCDQMHQRWLNSWNAAGMKTKSNSNGKNVLQSNKISHSELRTPAMVPQCRRLSQSILWNGTSNGFVYKAKWDHLNRLALWIRQKTSTYDPVFGPNQNQRQRKFDGRKNT